MSGRRRFRDLMAARLARHVARDARRAARTGSLDMGALMRAGDSSGALRAELAALCGDPGCKHPLAWHDPGRASVPCLTTSCACRAFTAPSAL